MMMMTMMMMMITTLVNATKKLKYLAQHTCCIGVFVEHKMMSFLCFVFRKDMFTGRKIEQREHKDWKRGKSTEQKQPEKDKILFLKKQNAFESWWRLMTKDLKFTVNSAAFNG